MAHLHFSLSSSSSCLGAGCRQRQPPACRRPAATAAAAPATISSRARRVAVCSKHTDRQLQQQQEETHASSSSRQRTLSGVAAAAFAGAALLLVPGVVHPPSAAAAPGEPPANSAILGELRRLRQTEKRYTIPGNADPGAALAGRFAAVGDQLQRVRLLVQIQQYDSARMQLRQGAFANLRGDLRYEQDYRGVDAKVASSVVQGVEQLDRKLRAKEPLAEVQPLLDSLQQQLAAVVEADKR